LEVIKQKQSKIFLSIIILSPAVLETEGRIIATGDHLLFWNTKFEENLNFTGPRILMLVDWA
jgi:hypothetical protein